MVLEYLSLMLISSLWGFMFIMVMIAFILYSVDREAQPALPGASRAVASPTFWEEVAASPKEPKAPVVRARRMMGTAWPPAFSFSKTQIGRAHV